MTYLLLFLAAQVILKILARFLESVADAIHFKRPKSADVLRSIAELFDRLAILIPSRS